MSGLGHRWTHSICCDCWDKQHPDRLANAEVRANDSGMNERCCYCGIITRTGIYTRESVNHVDIICDTFV